MTPKEKAKQLIDLYPELALAIANDALQIDALQIAEETRSSTFQDEKSIKNGISYWKKVKVEVKSLMLKESTLRLKAQIKQSIIDGELIVTTDSLIREAVTKSIGYVKCESHKDLTAGEIESICDQVIIYLTE